MEVKENQNVMSSRDKLKERYAKKYPEKDFNTEESANLVDDEVLAEVAESENELVKVMFDKAASDEQFLSCLSSERENGTLEYINFRRFINGLKLALGY